MLMGGTAERMRRVGGAHWCDREEAPPHCWRVVYVQGGSGTIDTDYIQDQENPLFEANAKNIWYQCVILVLFSEFYCKHR